MIKDILRTDKQTDPRSIDNYRRCFKIQNYDLTLKRLYLFIYLKLNSNKCVMEKPLNRSQPDVA